MSSAHHDAQEIRKAIKGLGTDDKTLINIIPHRSSEQLQQIVSEYVGSFGIKLVDDIKGDTSGHYEELLVGLLESKPHFAAKTIHEAIKGAGTDESAIIDSLVHVSNHRIKEIVEAYHKHYNKSLASDIGGDTSGDFKKLLTGMLNATRDESGHVNHEQAHKDAELLYKKGEGKIGTDEETFIEFFLRSSYAHIYEVDKCYKEKHKHGLAKAIEKEFSGHIGKLLQALATPRVEYWAGRIHAAVKGLGTNDKALIRAFVFNHEPGFLKQIDAVYKAHYKEDLEHAVKGDTSGHYRDVLLGLIH